MAGGSIVGVGAIILSGGAATLVVAGLLSVGASTTILYGASDIYEGGDTYRLADAGDLTSIARNPIRDSVFNGNQMAYDTWGTIGSLAFLAGGMMQTAAISSQGTVQVENLTERANAVGKGAGGAKTPEQIIKDRTKNLDLNPHPTIQKQLSSKKMSELKAKIDNRTITKAEYEQYNWNKKITKVRQTAVDGFWDDEIIRITENNPSRNWSQTQIDDIMAGKKPKYNGKTLQGHHSYSVSQYPQLAGKSEVIWPTTPSEHLSGWHGGNWKNSLPGKPIVDINDF